MSSRIKFATGFFVKRNFQRQLNKIENNTIRNELLDAAASALLRRNRQRFLKAKDPDGTRWPDSIGSLRRSAGKKDSQGISRVGSDGNVLFSTGSLFFSLQVFKAKQNSKRRFVGVNPAFRNTKTKVPVKTYAKHIARGTPNMPAREFLGVSNKDATVIEAILQRRLETILKN